MNRIYKVVWSKAKNCYTVVSEIAKRHGKGNRARACAAAFLAAFALTGVMGMGEAQAAPDANVYTVNTLNANNNLTVGGIAGNGFYQFFVDSNGAFHAAANKFSVDEDGKVTATEGEIGGVTIKEGNITGVNAINTSAINTNVLNSKYNLSVGTANPNGTMPFFVNSNGAFYAANGKLVVDKDGNVTAGKVTATEGEIGNVVLKNGVYTGHSALRDGELLVGDASGNYSQITTKGAKLGKVIVAEDGKITGVAAGALTADSTDAVNGSQLKQTNDNVASNKEAIGTLNTRVDGLDDRVTNNTAAINKNKEAIGTLNTRVDGLDDRVTNNTAAINKNKEAIGTLNTRVDGLDNRVDGLDNRVDGLDNRVTNVESLAKQHTTVEAGNNITVTESTNTDGGKKYTVGMAKDITVDSVKVGDDIYVSNAGLNANGKTITNVKDGKVEEGSKDAVNGGQLYATNQLVKENASNISLLGNSINKLDNRVDKVGAGAAALAALHPLGFDPEDKWDFAAGYGNYSGASAVALGAYYRPNEDTMFSVGGSFGNGENMVNAGVSLKLGQSSHAPTSKEAAMEKKISSLSQEVEELKAAIADLRAAQTKAKDATEKDAQKK